MSDPLRKVQPGQQLRIPAAAYNAFVDAAIAQRGGQHDIASEPAALQRSRTTIRIRNQTGAVQQRFAVLALSIPTVGPAASLQQFQNEVVFDAVVPANPMSEKRFVVLTEPLAAGAIGRAVLYGATPVSLLVTNETHQFASPLHNTTTFMVTTASNGQYRILWKESGTAFKWGIVAAEPSAATPAIVFQLTTPLAAGIAQLATGQIVISSDSASYPVGGGVTIYNTGLSKGAVGARGIAMYFNGVWWVYELNQPAVLARFLFTGSTHSPGGGDTFGDLGTRITITYSGFTAITPYPFGLTPSATIANPSNLIALAGDSGLCVWDNSTEQYILIDVYPATIRRFYFKLTANWPNGLDQTSTSAVCMHSDGSTHGGNLVGSTITLKDRWNVALNAKTDDVGICQLNHKTGQFDIVEISHVFTVGRGKVASAFSDTPATISVTDIVGFNGRVPGSSHLSVDNELQIESAKEDDLLELRWNPITGKFYALPPSGGKGTVFPVKMIQTGGSQGSATAGPTWVYEVRDALTNDVLASGVDPGSHPHQFKRPNIGCMEKATFGYAHYEGEYLVIGWCNEQFIQERCTTTDPL